jgi:hypothetical protein
VRGAGGCTRRVYEIGALRALDRLAVNRTVNDFDDYVGTSAGSFVGSMLANGVTPEEMMRVLNKRLPSPLEDQGGLRAAAPLLPTSPLLRGRVELDDLAHGGTGYTSLATQPNAHSRSVVQSGYLDGGSRYLEALSCS